MSNDYTQSVLFRVLYLMHHVHSFSKDKSVHAKLAVLNRYPVNGFGPEVADVAFTTSWGPGYNIKCNFRFAYHANVLELPNPNELLKLEIAKWVDWLNKEQTINAQIKLLILQAWEGFFE